MKPRESEWYRVGICRKCHNKLKEKQQNYGGGICPYCGHNSKSTVCDTISVIIKETAHHPWWRFWNKEFSYQGLDSFSKEWLKTK